MKIEKFKNELIAFDENNEMVNATDMLKAFPNKRMNDFLRLQSTKDFIRELEMTTETGFPATIIKQGGTGQGTWMQRILALKFAGWLDAKFEIFVYSVFDNFLKEQIRLKSDKIREQQKQLDYFWDKQDINDLYNR